LLSKCTKIVFKNNGIPFRPEDWQRLKRIAEGNPGKKKKKAKWMRHLEEANRLV
jgi:hypothetical protein